MALLRTAMLTIMSPYEQLISQLVRSGVSRAEAEPAVRRCLSSMSLHAVAGYSAGGLLAYFLNANPISAFGYTAISTTLGAGYALNSSPSCVEVRTAIRYWTNL